MSALVDGLIAGYGIAIPVGAVSVLIVNLAIKNGFRSGFLAGAGTATVDLTCAAIAVLAGTAVVGLLLPYESVLKVASAAVLIAMGAYGILALRKERNEGPDEQESGTRTFFKFIAITALNPFTVVYFMALIMGNGGDWHYSDWDCFMFVAGVAFASLSWQTILAWLGATVRKHISTRFMQGTIIAGNLLVIALGLNILLF